MRASRAVFLLAALLFVCNVWGYDLWAPDEPFFGEGAREMLVDGHWLVSHINGVVNSHKPPLFFWLIALFSAPFGQVHSLTARLPSILAALGTLALVGRLGKRIAGERTATLAVLILTISYLFWDKARSAQIDAVLCFLIWVALSAFESYRSGDADGRRAGLLFWLAAVLAVLAKGPVGLLIPLGIAVVTLAVDRDLSRWRGFAPLTGPLLFAGATALYVGAVELWGPSGYTVWGALKVHFVDRGVHGLHHAQPFWYYAKVLPPQLLPWTALVPGALLLAWRRRDRGDRFLLVIALFVIVFFSISTEKRTLYVLPAFPAFALMIARLVGATLGWEPAAILSRRWVTVAHSLTGGLLVFVGLLFPVAGRRFEQGPAWAPWVLATVFVVAGLATVWSMHRGRVLSSLGVTAAGVAAAYLLAAVLLFPALNPSKSSKAFSLKIQKATAESRASGHAVLASGLGNLPTHFAFYSNGDYTVETDDPAELAVHMSQKDQVFAVVRESLIEELPDRIREEMVVIDRTRLNRREALLVANHGDPGSKDRD